MKTFKVGVFEEQGGYLFITAKNEQEAKRIAKSYVNDYGLGSDNVPPNAYPAINGFEQTHRDTFLV